MIPWKQIYAHCSQADNTSYNYYISWEENNLRMWQTIFFFLKKKLVNIDRSKCLQFEEMKAHVPFMGKNQKRWVVKMIAESSI